jgi:serine/threonine protein kinase
VDTYQQYTTFTTVLAMGCCQSGDKSHSEKLLAGSPGVDNSDEAAIASPTSVCSTSNATVTHSHPNITGLGLSAQLCTYLSKRGYKVESSLGKGKYSTVYKAIYSPSNGKSDNTIRVALKVTNKPKPSGSSTTRSAEEEDLDRCIKSEVAILKSLNHKNIVKLVDFFEDKDHYFTAEELIEGGELFDHIMQHVSFTEHDARIIVKSLLETLQYMHQHHIAHRDLKPENLLLTKADETGDIKIADFGFATSVVAKDKADKKSLSMDHPLTTQCGTLEFMAPEIVQGRAYGNHFYHILMFVFPYVDCSLGLLG